MIIDKTNLEQVLVDGRSKNLTRWHDVLFDKNNTFYKSLNQLFRMGTTTQHDKPPSRSLHNLKNNFLLLVNW